MSVEYFMDTNVFIYAFSPHEPAKKARAASLIRSALSDSIGVISSQVVQEFINVAVHKPVASVPPTLLLDYMDHVLHPLCRVMPSPSLYLKAIQLHRDTQYRFYDCLIVAAALESGAKILYSEDLQNGRSFGEMKIVNPFA